MRKAEADWELVGLIGTARPALRDLACFHCQQMVEKYLKALLQERGLVVPRTHNLLQLLDLLLSPDPTLRQLRRGCKSLSRFAVDYRYPGVTATSRQVNAAVRLAQHLRRTLRLRLGLPV